jgi:signal transduction histidine kinase
VTAADESRRRIERDLHDGAQQHLVALAVKVGLVKQLMEGDPATATRFVEELRDDVQATLTELRSLAHGIYPPLLRDRGLVEALRTAANRSTLPTDVSSGGVGRYDPGVEAAVYFCCLEAMQNAAKHAGDGATVTVSVVEEPGRLRFEVSDTGPGFDVDTVIGGSGFVNMADRLGAVGGTLDVSSSPEGTNIGGVIAVDAAVTDQPDGADAPAEPTVA